MNMITYRHSTQYQVIAHYINIIGQHEHNMLHQTMFSLCKHRQTIDCAKSIHKIAKQLAFSVIYLQNSLTEVTCSDLCIEITLHIFYTHESQIKEMVAKLTCCSIAYCTVTIHSTCHRSAGLMMLLKESGSFS